MYSFAAARASSKLLCRDWHPDTVSASCTFCRKTEELVSIKFLDRRRGAVDSATQGEILNHRKLHSPHIARLNEVRVFCRCRTVLVCA